MFISGLVNSGDSRYLEIGSWTGSTLCAALSGNEARATAIDNFSQWDGRAELIKNITKFCPRRVNLIDKDFREVDYSALGKFNIYLFDGPHERADQFDGVMKVFPALEEQFVLIVDDWNWEDVRLGTFDALAQLNVQLIYKEEIRTTMDNSHASISGPQSDWHNGVMIAVVQKNLD